MLINKTVFMIVIDVIDSDVCVWALVGRNVE